MVRFGAANRDGKKFEAPSEVRLDRDPAERPMTFGLGIHYCVGFGLAKMEIAASLRAWLSTFSQITLASPDEPLHFHASLVLRGPVRLDLSLFPA
jgi:cytochrome P450